MENIYLEIGKRIRQQRKAHGLTREEFAENLSTTMQYISRLERAKNKVSIEYLYRIADALDCSIYTLLPATQLPQRKFFSEELIDGSNVLVWQNDGLTYQVSSSCDLSEIISVAEGIKLDSSSNG